MLIGQILISRQGASDFFTVDLNIKHLFSVFGLIHVFAHSFAHPQWPE